MSRSISKVAPGWWDYTTLDEGLLADAAKLTAKDLAQLSRPGFTVRIFDTLEALFCAEAMEYVAAWQQLPLVAQIVNDLGLNLGKHDAHFWGMDEWVDADGKPVEAAFPLSFARADKQMCFERIKPGLAIPEANLHFPTGDLEGYSASYDSVRCLVMQGGQGEVKHWAFNDPPKREGDCVDQPPSKQAYRQLKTRVTDLHPMTIIQNARTSGGGYVPLVPTRACTVGPVETWKAERVSIWHPGHHDNPFGMRLTALMISKKIVDTSVPMSLLADHPEVAFSYYRGGIGTVTTDMH